MTARDDGLAGALVLRHDDLGEGWTMTPATDAAGSAGGALTACVDDDFPHEHLVASAESPAWTRPPAALAYGTSLVFDTEAAAVDAREQLARPSFAERFAAEVAGDVGGTQPASEWLGGTAATEADDGDVVHHLTFAGGDAAGVRPVHVDLAVAGVGRAVLVLWLGDSPARFPPDERRRIVARVLARA